MKATGVTGSNADLEPRAARRVDSRGSLCLKYPGSLLTSGPSPLIVKADTKTAMSGWRVLVVDDHASVRKGVCELLRSRKTIDVCAEAADGRDAVAKTTALRPALVIMDISMPVLDGLSATREIRKISPQTAVIILSMHDSQEMVETARQAGARGYVTKGKIESDLLIAVESVLRGELFFPS